MTALCAAIAGCGGAEPGQPAAAPDETERAFPGRSGPLRQGVLHTDDGDVKLSYQEIDGLAVVEGDIVFPLAMLGGGGEGGASGAARTAAASRWPDGVVPYVIDSGLGNQSRVTDALNHWRSNTTLRFVPRTTQADYVRFVSGSGCSSSLGRIGGAQNVTLASTCSTGSAIHEIGHAVGLFHEQTRADRDRYVRINWANIESGKEHNFQTYIVRDKDGLDVGLYDYGSIMHYGRTAFSTNGQDTITPLQSGVTIGQRTALSSRDIATVTYMYEELNRDRLGSDYASFDLPAARPELCQAACARDNRCRAHTYVRPGVQGPSARCWLKNAVPAPVVNYACVSGVRRALEVLTDRAGSDYTSFDLSAADPNLCKDACARDGRCRSFTYVNPGVQGPSARCWLKDGVPAATLNFNTTSGVKRGLEYNTDRVGADYRNFAMSVADPAYCQATCAAESACQSFTYGEPGLVGSSAHCWLKSGIPAATFNGRTISGIKGLEF